jgi:hypothetical protein
MNDSSAGPLLEARAQRLFLAQGSFAERGVFPTATPDRRMLATDIDVLVSEYVSGFHLTRRHIECKSGRFALLDRILWLNGVRTLLRADSSYLIAQDVDLEATEFARNLDVELFTTKHLDTWEKSIGISGDVWPGRSDYLTFDMARSVWRKASDKEDEVWRFLRAALAFVEIESWLTFRYRLLNKLLRLIRQLSHYYDATLQGDCELCARYVFSALLVRFAQYLLAICEDASRVLPTEIEKYLTNRLTFGDQDPDQAMDFTKATVEWVRRALTANRLKMPNEIDTARLHTPPEYTPEFAQLVRRLLDQSQDARYLTLAVERMQFGSPNDDALVRFKAAANSAEGLAALVRAFIARTFKVATKLAAPVRGDLIAAYRISSNTARFAAQTNNVNPSPVVRQKRGSSRHSVGSSGPSRTGVLKEDAGTFGPGKADQLSDDAAKTEQPMLPGTTPEPAPALKEPEDGTTHADPLVESGAKPTE